MKYANLHHHSAYSVLDGHALIDDYVDRLVKLGHTHAAVTDHGTMAALPSFFKAASKQGITPIAGLEAYFVPHDLSIKDAEHRKSYHLTLLARNEEGFHNLIRLSSIASVHGMYYRPRLDLPTLQLHANGITCFSGCLAGIVAQKLLANEEAEALFWIDQFRQVFGEHYWLEFQNHGHDIPDQITVNRALARISRKHGLRVVATNDSHFCSAGDHDAHHTLLKIKGAGEVYSSKHAYLRSDAAMINAFGDNALLRNTLEIAQSCESYVIGEGTPKLPSSPYELDEADADMVLRSMVEQGLSRRFGVPYHHVPFDYMARADHEIGVISRMGFSRYILIIADLARFAVDRNIRFGARGSAAGSICCWALNISELDPLKYGLYFERFLNPERVAMPDIDMDFADDRRDEVLRYLQQTYGEDRVARIGTYAKIGAKSALRDAARMVRDLLTRDYMEVGDELAAMIPRGQHEVLLQEVLDDETSPLCQRLQVDPEAVMVVDAAKQIAGRLRGVGMHAAGILVADRPLESIVPLSRTTNHKQDALKIQTQWEDDWLEEIGLLKLDVLGLSELAKISLAIEMIESSTGQPVDLASLGFDDRRVWEVFVSGDTLGLFQIGGKEITGAITGLRPESLDDLALLLAVYRPGPVKNLAAIIASKHGIVPVRSIHPALDPILSVTYGFPVYQEQIIEIVCAVAGYSRGKADLVRKAMGKKLVDELAKHRADFLAGAVQNGYSEDEAATIWSYIEPFAGYGFNKAHAYAYAAVCYQSAWIKAMHPQQFYAASMIVESRTNGKAGETAQDRIGAFAMEARRRGITLLPPSLEHPSSSFAPVGEAAIQYGLSAIKGVGHKAAHSLASNAPYANLSDLVIRSEATRDVYETLAKIGAMPQSWGERATVSAQVTRLCDARKYRQAVPRVNETRQEALLRGRERMLSEMRLIEQHPVSQPEYSQVEMLEQELGHCGIVWSAIPEFPDHDLKIADLGLHVGRQVNVSGIVSQIEPFVSRGKKLRMARGTLLDETAKIELLFWPSAWEQCETWLKPGCLVSLRGSIDYLHDPSQEHDPDQLVSPALLKIKVDRCDFHDEENDQTL